MWAFVRADCAGMDVYISLAAVGLFVVCGFVPAAGTLPLTLRVITLAAAQRELSDVHEAARKEAPPVQSMRTLCTSTPKFVSCLLQVGRAGAA